MDIEVWTWLELVRRAGSPGRARGLLRDGAVVRLLRDAYVGSEHAPSTEVRVAALRAVLPPDVAVTGRAALWLLGMDVLGRDPVVDVVAPRGRMVRHRPGVRAWSAAVPDSELVETDGLLVVSAARVVVDAARRGPVHEAVALGDAALRAGVTTPDLLLDSLDRAGGLRGVQRARKVLPLLDGRSESLMESRVRVELVSAGFEPDVQLDVYDPDGEHVGRADLHVEGVVLEYDGFAVHTDKRAFGRDRWRGNRFGDVGLEVRRFSAADWYDRPRGLLAATVRRAVLVARDRVVTARRGPDTLRAPRRTPPDTLDRERPAA